MRRNYGPLLRASRTRLTALVGALAVVFAACGAGSSSNHATVRVSSTGQIATVTVSAATMGRPIPAGFLGLSIELNAIEKYAGTDPSAINPVFLALVQNLTPGQAPVLRLGGDSTDWAWWPAPGLKRPAGASVTLTPRWLRVTRAMTQALSARLILGIDLEAGSARAAGTEARALAAGLPRSSIQALELGNEPLLYATFTWGRSGAPGRPPGYNTPQIIADYARIGSALPRLPLAGPAIGSPHWYPSLRGFLKAEPRIRIATLHRYPLQKCFIAPSRPQFPTIAHLLGPTASTGLADTVAPYTGLVHARGLTVRIDEMNTVSCGSGSGVADTFASALWATDALFEMARVGVDGVNLHTYPHATYELFSFNRAHGSWQGTVTPEYYGLLLFGQAAPPGSHLLRVTARGASGLKAWATRTSDGTIRVTLINESSGSRTVSLKSTSSAPSATMLLLRAPSLGARSGITFAGASFASHTTTGTLTGAHPTSLTLTGGRCVLQLPRAGEAVVTIPPH
jgi:hypothetical protein